MKQDILDKPLMYLFMHIGKLLNDNLRNSLNERNIHFGQARILVALRNHKKLIQREIGSGLQIKPAAVTNLVKRMEASGLIDRRQDPNDDRIMNVTLTSKGIEAADFAVKVMQQTEEKISSQLSTQEIKKLGRSLVTVRDTFGGSTPDIK